jgi:DNA-directed RNA polymerase specialized sigma24 family protein
MTTEHHAQLRTTLGVLRSRRSTEVPGALQQSMAEAHGAEVAAAIAADGPQLLALAQAIDPEHAEDLVQTAWADVLSESGSTDLPAVLDRLAQLAERHRAADADTGVDTDPAREDRVTEISDTGPDEDEPAELYYPSFYEETSNLGDWVESPNSWPDGARILGPDAQIDTEELYGVVDAALAELPASQATLVNLVDVQDVPLEVAARTVGIDPAAAGKALGRARHQVRMRLHAYLDGAETA